MSKLMTLLGNGDLFMETEARPQMAVSVSPVWDSIVNTVSASYSTTESFSSSSASPYNKNTVSCRFPSASLHSYSKTSVDINIKEAQNFDRSCLVTLLQTIISFPRYLRI